MADIIFDRPLPQREPGFSTFEDNYQFFVRAVRGDADRVWRGLQRLEHVYIALTDDASPQQVFETLNSTGAPLKNHELVHNYVLMGLSHSEQMEIEDSYWLPLEKNTGDRQQLLDAIYAGQPFRTVIRDLELTSNRVFGLARTDQDWSQQLEAALTASRREDLEHGTNAAYLHGCVCSECRTYQQVRMGRSVAR